MKEIKLNKGFVALVDDEDFERVNKFNWFVLKGTSTYYAQRTFWINGKQYHQYLHQFMFDYFKSKDSKRIVIDHINHNGLDNTRINIRECTHSQNRMNQIPINNKTSIYKGVDWSQKSKKYRAKIGINHKSIHIGFFASEKDAAIAYDMAAKKYHGDFAYLNFPD